MQLAKFKIRYHFMAYKKLAIAGPADLVINLHIAFLPLDVHLPIGPKQGAFSIHMQRLSENNGHDSSEEQQFQVKFGKIGTFQYVPVQILWQDVPAAICSEEQVVHSALADHLHKNFNAVSFSIRWCQVNEAEVKCLCFDIAVQHEPELPLMTCCGEHQIVVQHQCPAADTYRAEVPLTVVKRRAIT